MPVSRTPRPVPPSLPPIKVATLDELGERYGAFLVDQFGVLHDGYTAYAGAPEALKRLKDTGKPVILISNSGRPAAFNIERLVRLGFTEESFTAFLTSGDLAIERLKAGDISLAGATGSTRCLTISGTDDSNLAIAMGYESVSSAREADLVVISGSRGHEIALDEYREMLAPAARRNLPAICTNPDFIMLTGRGVAYGPGRIAKLYQDMGGTVHWIGKPGREIYEQTRRFTGDLPREQILCIGDSVEHDVVGARTYGAHVALTRTGILESRSDAELAVEITRHKAIPDWLLPAFR